MRENRNRSITCGESGVAGTAAPLVASSGLHVPDVYVADPAVIDPRIVLTGFSDFLPKRQTESVVGHRVPPRRFVVREVSRAIDSEVLNGLLHGTEVALVVREYLRPAEAEHLASGFKIALRRSRSDDVPALTIGAGHYGKSTRGYFAEVRRTSVEMRKAYAAAGVNLDAKTSEDIQRVLDPGQVVRAAQHHGCAALPMRAAAWTGSSTSQMALDAHEDEQQLRDPRQRGFEIQEVSVPVAVNVYVHMPPKGGALRVWNCQPSVSCKQDLGVTGRGYPYPSDALGDIDFIDVTPYPGDLVLLNGRFLHAVLGWEGSPLERVLYNGFIGLSLDGCSVLRWS